MPKMPMRGKMPKTSAREEPFQWMSEQMHKPKSGSPMPARKMSMSPAAKVRARSVGVSSSSRQRTNKRGPQNRKKG